LDANLRDDLPWTFRPVQKASGYPGALGRVAYEVGNTSDQAVFGQAIELRAAAAAQYVKKLECFATRQELGRRDAGDAVMFVIERGLRMT
jgi:cytochrome c oxidase assembly protein Cox11